MKEKTEKVRLGASRFDKGFKCPKCGAGGHHIFTFGPSMKFKIANCGQRFSEDNRVVIDEDRLWADYEGKGWD